MSETLYFAYGSNINLNQMAVRCPDAKVVEPAVLENYELLFRGNGSSFYAHPQLLHRHPGGLPAERSSGAGIEGCPVQSDP